MNKFNCPDCGELLDTDNDVIKQHVDFCQGNKLKVTLLRGDNREVLKTLADKSVNTCVTSPPYFGLRDYGEPGQIGLEETPEEYVAALVEVFREVKRVLRDDGTLWLNLGDSYSNPGNKNGEGETRALKSERFHGGKAHLEQRRSIGKSDLPPKNLIGIPWRVAFALQADGWILRSDIIEEVKLYCPCGCGYELEESIIRYSQDREIIWKKPNAMPESVTDRPTKSHEYIFLFSKQQKYYYDNEAIREPHARLWTEKNGGNLKDIGHKKNGKIETKQTHPKGYPLPNPNGANKRSVWTVASQPYSGAHYAVFPEKLIEPCILAGTSDKGYCPICGAPWQRVIEKEKFDRTNDKPYGGSLGGNPTGKVPGSNTRGIPMANIIELGWQQSCKCPPAPPIPGTVLDPFGGSGTTGRVAVKNRRNAILIELNPDYHKQIEKRTDGVQVRLF